MKIQIPVIILTSCVALIACNSAEISTNSANTQGSSDPVEAVFTQTSENTRNDPEEWFDEANTLAATGQDESVYLESLGSLVTQYVEITKAEGYPTGLNFEITNKLLGQNSSQIALIDANHPLINDDGEIVDSWGTPYYFHSETLSDISIQSAGADLKHYTDDDIVYEELNALAGVVVVTDSSDGSEDSGLGFGAATAYKPSTFDTYETGELLPQ